jgi:hypothetical protein
MDTFSTLRFLFGLKGLHHAQDRLFDGVYPEQGRRAQDRPFITPPSCGDQEGEALIDYTREPLSVSSRRAALFSPHFNSVLKIV